MPDLLAHLRDLQGTGTRHALAVRLGVPHPVLYQVLSGRMAPPPRLLAAVGWERVVTYQPIAPTTWGNDTVIPVIRHRDAQIVRGSNEAR
jgi:DNA-binding transcriptional regulator YdaS (Cro superfamily)